jgi:ATP-dependent protease ClpP protease subunit
MQNEVYKPGKRRWYNLATNDETGEASAYLYDDIGGYGITAKDFIEEVNFLKAGRLNVRINSYGGEIDQGVAIYNYLKQRKDETYVYVDGIAASIASIIAMAGDKIIMGEAALMFIHNPWTMTAGDAESLQREAANLEKRKAALLAIYTEKTGLPADLLSQMMDEETLLNAEEAVSMGFADEMDSIKEPEMAFNSTMYNKVVSAMARKIKHEEVNMSEKTPEVIEEVAPVAEELATEEVPVVEEVNPEASVEPEQVEQAEEAAPEVIEDQPEVVVDARAEFKEFVNAFGPDRAANYFAAGLSMEAAKAAYMDELVKENADLKAKLANTETVKPVASKPSDDSDVPVTFTREQIRRMSAEDYRKNREAINKAQAEGRIK